MKQLEFAVNSSGDSWDKSGDRIKDYLGTLSEATKFQDDELAESFQTLLKNTGNVDSSMRLLNIAMNTSVATHKSLNEISQTLGIALLSPERGMIMLRREFGSFVGSGNDVVKALKVLELKTKNYALSQDDMIERTEKMNKKWKDTWQGIGKAFLEVWNRISEYIFKLPENMEKAMATIRALWNAGWKGLAINHKNFIELEKQYYKEIEDKYKMIEDSKQEKAQETFDKLKDKEIKSLKERRKYYESAFETESGYMDKMIEHQQKTGRISDDLYYKYLQRKLAITKTGTNQEIDIRQRMYDIEKKAQDETFVGGWKIMLDKMNKESESWSGRFSDLVRDMQGALGSAFEKMITQSKSFEASMSDLWRDILAAIIKQIAVFLASETVQTLLNLLRKDEDKKKTVFTKVLDFIGLQSGIQGFKGGWAMVGEEGPELRYLPQGTNIYSNRESMRMLAGAGGITINITGNTISNKMDLNNIANVVAETIYKRVALQRNIF